VNECKPLPAATSPSSAVTAASAPSHAASACALAVKQGLTLVHFSAQPQPFLTLKTSPTALNTPSTPAINIP